MLSKRLALLALALSSLPTLALADGGAASTTKGDNSPSLLNINNVDNGEILISKFPTRVTLGHFTDSNGRAGLSLNFNSHHTVYLFGDDTNYSQDFSTAAAFRLDAGIRLKWNQAAGQFNQNTLRFHLESPRLGVIATQGGTHSDGKMSLPTFTYNFNAFSAAYQYNNVKPLAYKSSVVDFEYLNGGIHHAFKLNGVNVDYCLQVAGVLQQGQLRAGEQKNNTAYGLRALACMGVQVGKLFNLRDEVQVQSLWRNTYKTRSVDADGVVSHSSATGYAVSLTNAVRLDRVGNSPVGLEWSMSREWNRDANDSDAGRQVKTYNQHIFGITGTF